MTDPVIQWGRATVVSESVYGDDEAPQAWLDHVKDLALNVVNDIRVAMLIGEGKLDELPPAIPTNPDECVLAIALSNGWSTRVSTSEITLFHEEEGRPDKEGFQKLYDALHARGYRVSILREEEWNEAKGAYVEKDPYAIAIQHTPVTEKFIDLFDNGYYPELDINNIVTSDDAGQH